MKPLRPLGKSSKSQIITHNLSSLETSTSETWQKDPKSIESFSSESYGRKGRAKAQRMKRFSAQKSSHEK